MVKQNTFVNVSYLINTIIRDTSGYKSVLFDSVIIYFKANNYNINITTPTLLYFSDDTLISTLWSIALVHTAQEKPSVRINYCLSYRSINILVWKNSIQWYGFHGILVSIISLQYYTLAYLLWISAANIHVTFLHIPRLLIQPCYNLNIKLRKTQKL